MNSITFFLLSIIAVVRSAFVPDDTRFKFVVKGPGTKSYHDAQKHSSSPSLLPYYLTNPSYSSSSSLDSLKLFMAKNDRGTRVVAKAPILKNWSKNTDGTITANIFNSPDFKNNEKVTTSRIVERKLASGQLVTSISGSKYRLEGKELKRDPSSDAAQKRGTFKVGNQGRLAKGTFSVKNAKFGPRGVPTLRKWKQNSDGSISGRIFGSKGFQENEFVTTSPIKGTPVANSVARTISGSRYYLEGNGSVPNKLVPKRTGTMSVREESQGEKKGLGSYLASIVAFAAATIFGFNSLQGPSVNDDIRTSVSSDLMDKTVNSVSSGSNFKANTMKPVAPLTYKADTQSDKKEVSSQAKEKEMELTETEKNYELQRVTAKEEEERIRLEKEKMERTKAMEEERVRLEYEKQEMERIKAMEAERKRELERMEADAAKAKAEAEKNVEQTQDESESADSITTEVQEVESQVEMGSTTKNIIAGIGATAALSVAVAVSVANQKPEYMNDEEVAIPAESPSPQLSKKEGDQVPRAIEPKSSGKQVPIVQEPIDITTTSSSVDQTRVPPSNEISTFNLQDVVTTTKTTSTTTTTTSSSSTMFLQESVNARSTENSVEQVQHSDSSSPKDVETETLSVEKSTETKIEESIESFVESYCENFVEKLSNEMDM